MEDATIRSLVIGQSIEITTPEDWYLKAAAFDQETKLWNLVLAKYRKKTTKRKSSTDIEESDGPLPF